MVCRNCGTEMNNSEGACSNCGAPGVMGYGNGSMQEIRTTKSLVFAIIQLFLFTILGITSLILYFTKVNPAAKSGNLAEVRKYQKIISVLFYISLIVPVMMFVLIILVAIPNFSGIQVRMQVRADKATAAQIGKSVRIWYTEAINDPIANDEYNVEELNGKFVKYTELKNIESYIPTMYTPSTYINYSDSAYYVGMSNSGTPNDITDDNLIVAIGPEDLNRVSRGDRTFNKIFNKDLSDFETADYDGSGSGIAYVEPRIIGPQSNY